MWYSGRKKVSKKVSERAYNCFDRVKLMQNYDSFYCRYIVEAKKY